MTTTHPRRSQKTTLSPMTLQSIDKSQSSPQSLRKGATFHIPSTPASALPCHLVRRAESSLEDIVEAHKRRVALTLDDIEAGLSDLNLGATRPTAQSFRDDSLPVPQGLLNHTVDKRYRAPNIAMSPIPQDAADITIGRHSLRPRRHNRRQSIPSDSGLGSSIASSSAKKMSSETRVAGGHANVSVSATTRSAGASQPSLAKASRLSEKTKNKFRQLIFQPLLEDSSLEAFHSLVKDCPRRINENEIVCLRDLEKTLLLMAPERPATANAYYDFCQLSIHCIQATVEHVSDRELTRPNERPYSNGYFVDLVEQLRSHARALATSREKVAKGESLGDMDIDGSEPVRLYGGPLKNGRPAELVAIKKDGTAVSMATGKEVPMESIEEDERSEMKFKRSHSEEMDDEEVARSMARRKASPTAAELAPKRCAHAGCAKEFKRACDLTKHEKTHSRPWKCSDHSCRYHDYGWPTEKELERHRNDKHSANPRLFKCQFPPCAYSSKRESNCKQHMEKSHNWTYVRSKNNGKNRDQQARGSLPTPQDTNLQTPVTDHRSTPDDMRFDGSEGSVTFNDEIYNDSHNHISYAGDFQYHGGLSLDQPQQFHISPADSNLQYSSANTSPFMENSTDFAALDSVAANFGAQNDFTLYEDLYNANASVRAVPFTMLTYQQQLPPTPEKALFGRSYDSTTQFQNHNPVVSAEDVPQHLSPIGQGSAMLFTPASMMDVDDSFDFLPSDNGFEGDFSLFGNTDNTFLPATKDALFGELPSSAMHQFGAQVPFMDFYAQTSQQVNGEWYDDAMMDLH